MVKKCATIPGPPESSKPILFGVYSKWSAYEVTPKRSTDALRVRCMRPYVRFAVTSRKGLPIFDDKRESRCRCAPFRTLSRAVIICTPRRLTMVVEDRHLLLALKHPPALDSARGRGAPESSIHPISRPDHDHNNCVIGGLMCTKMTRYCAEVSVDC